jgi:thiopurine S-methyltransferase
MQPQFWHDRWEQNKTGFHQQTVNEHLKYLWPKTSLSEGAHVLVPLCGKTKDMIWLCEHGYNVTGIELSEKALKDFCIENEIEPSYHEDGGNSYCQIRPDFSLICSDFFSVSPDQVGQVDAVYDRAALVALPPEMRIDYVNHMDFLLKSGTRVFLVTMEYDQSKMYGPPFSVSEKEVHSLFSGKFDIELVHSEDIKSSKPELAGEKTTEKIYLLTKN